MCIYTHHEYSVLDITCVYVRDLGPFVCTFANFFCEFMWVKKDYEGIFWISVWYVLVLLLCVFICSQICFEGEERGK